MQARWSLRQSVNPGVAVNYEGAPRLNNHCYPGKANTQIRLSRIDFAEKRQKVAAKFCHVKNNY